MTTLTATITETTRAPRMSPVQAETVPISSSTRMNGFLKLPSSIKAQEIGSSRATMFGPYVLSRPRTCAGVRPSDSAPRV